MTVNYAPGAIEGIRRFIWSRLQSELGWTPINNLIPVMESQQEPEIQTDKPFIIYNWTFDDQGVMTELSKESAIFVVYGKQGDVRKTVQFLVDLLKRWEWSADDVNRYISGLANSTSTAPLKKFDYKEIHVTLATGPDPAVQEDGRHEGTVLIKYKYTHEVDSNPSRLGMRS